MLFSMVGTFRSSRLCFYIWNSTPNMESVSVSMSGVLGGQNLQQAYIQVHRVMGLFDSALR